MDIRVAAYNPVTVSTFSRPGSPLATAVVQNAQQSGPVSAARSTSRVNSSAANAAAEAFRNLAPQNQRISQNPSGGYTDSVRGSLVNILA